MILDLASRSGCLVPLGVKDYGNLGSDDVMLRPLLVLHPIRLVDVDSLVANLLEGLLHGSVDALDVVGIGQLQVLLDGLLPELTIEISFRVFRPEAIISRQELVKLWSRFNIGRFSYRYNTKTSMIWLYRLLSENQY